jgi:glycosyltransferase involved in cell wall biosynthesis
MPSSARRSPRVALVIKNLDVGGAEQQVLALCQGLGKRGWTPIVITLDEPSAADVLAPALTEAGISRRSVGIPAGARGARSIGWGYARALARVLSEEGVSIAHGHMVNANLLVRLAGTLAPNVRVIATVHNEHEAERGSLKLWLEDLLYRYSEPLGDLTTCVCRSGVQRHIQAGASSPEHICYMPNGIETSEWSRVPGARERISAELSLDAADFLWLWVGRFRPEKDHELLLRSFAHHVAGHPRSRLLLVGDGATKARAEALSRELGLTSKVYFLGLRRDVRELMSAADAFVMSSRREGMPIVLLEATLCGLPVVATNVGNIAEIIAADSGCVVARDPVALANAMTEVANDGRFRQQALARVPLLTQEYDLDQIAKRWIDLYARVLESSPRTAARRVSVLRDIMRALSTTPQ